jgi:hypothetical protein
MLLHVDQQRALEYLSGCIDQVQHFGDILQLVIVELIYKVNLISLVMIIVKFRFVIMTRQSEIASFVVFTIYFNLNHQPYDMKQLAHWSL